MHPRVVLVAEESAGLQVLKLVASSAAHELVGVLTSADPRRPGVARAARELGVSVWGAEAVRDPSLADRLAASQVDALLNVHSLYRIHPAVLEAPTVGAFNVHPGPLPGYAGLNAPSWAIYRGETRHAATLHWMVEAIDGGAIAYETWFDVAAHDTGLTLGGRCSRAGVEMVEVLLEALVADPARIPAREQDPTGRRYYGPEVPHGGRLPWSLPARQVVDFVRACDYGPFPSPWGRPTASLEGREVAVLEASPTGEATTAAPGTVGPEGGPGPVVAASDEWVAVRRVTVDGESADPREVLATGRIFDAEPIPGGANPG